MSDDGQGYTSKVWRDSKTAQYLCALPAVPVFSNEVPALYFACGIRAAPLPARTNFSNLEPNPNFPTEVAALKAAVTHQGGVVAILGWYGQERLVELGVPELVEGLKPVAVFDDGIVYGQ